jgi:alkylhydroperoxidase family enzyme
MPDDERLLGPARLALAGNDARDPFVRSVFDPVLDAGREVPALHRALAVAPAMLRAWRGMAPVLVTDCTSPASVRELMIMRVAQLLGSDYQFEHHRIRAKAAGVSDGQVERLAAWRTAEDFTTSERAALLAAEELTVDGFLTRPAYDGLAACYGAPEIVELVTTAAFYNCVCRVVGALFDEPPG